MTSPATPSQIPTSRTSFGLAGHPPGLSTLFFVELWERFSYYGMRALLTLFMVAPIAAGGLGFATEDATRIYGNYTMAVYLLPLAGGFIADHYLGLRRATFLGGLIITAGHFTLAMPTEQTFYLGLALIVIGTGLFKPCISAFVGALYGANDDRRDAGFSIFYLGINLGAFLAPLLTGFLAQSETFKAWLAANGFDPTQSWHWGFGAAGVGMLIGLLLFWRRMDSQLAGIGLPPEKPKDTRKTILQTGALVVGSLVLMGIILLSDIDGFQWVRALFVLAPLAGIIWFAMHGGYDGQRIAAILVLFIASMVFWAIFEQMGSAMSLFADRYTDNTINGWDMPSSYYQSLNPLFVILLAPIFAILWTRLGPRQPSSPVKFAFGLLLLCLSFLLMVPAAQLAVEGKVSPLWLVGLFFLQTAGELCLSPVGLSTITKLAPVKFVAFALGVWFLSASWGSKLAGILSSNFDASDPAGLTSFFLVQAALVAVATLLMFAVSPWVKKLMGDVR
ncbi:MAG: peptide MFS transporter [Hyphomicrobiaceae bacterium]